MSENGHEQAADAVAQAPAGDIVSQLQAALSREVTARQREQRDAMLAVGVLVRKLGRSVRVTGGDLLDATGYTLHRMDCADGFVLTVTKNPTGS